MLQVVQPIAVALVPGAILSVLTAYVTVRLAARQFTSQRWWEKQAEAYSEIIEHLAYLQYCCGEWFDSLVGATKIEDEVAAEMREQQRVAQEALKRATAVGEYVVSQEAIDSLQALFKALDSVRPNPAEEVDEHYAAIRDCLGKVRASAKRDLRGH